MPFTAQELENIANSTLDFFVNRGKVEAQTLQDKPLLAKMRSLSKTFPGGKEYISGAVKGEYTTTIQGFEHDDDVGYANPANTKRYNFPWKLIHSGIKFTMHELAKDGISIVDSTDGKSTSEHSGREMTAIANLLEEKFDDFTEGTDRGFNSMYWGDGTADPKLIPGIRSFILDDPTTNTVVGGIDQGVNTWWRNRASLSLASGTPSNLVVMTKLQNEWRQLRRYGGRPNLVLCGSSWLDFMEQELRSKGNFTLEGWTSKKSTDGSVADISFKGVNFEYDPTLDDIGRQKYCYVLDTRYIKPMVMEGEDMKKHFPARPENKYVFYRAMTYIGGLICNKRNAHGVYSIA
jgi:hypothetical protein